jgi:hypothetical protein
VLSQGASRRVGDDGKSVVYRRRHHGPMWASRPCTVNQARWADSSICRTCNVTTGWHQSVYSDESEDSVFEWCRSSVEVVLDKCQNSARIVSV